MTTWDVFINTGIVPDFPEKGKYRKWDAHWNFIGYSDDRQYVSQLPTKFPPDWAPLQCFLAVNAER